MANAEQAVRDGVQCSTKYPDGDNAENCLSPGVILAHGLGGSWDRQSAPALRWQEQALKLRRPFTRFEYRFNRDPTHAMNIVEWKEDIETVLNKCVNGPQVIIGSSLGGFAALLAAAAPENQSKIKGLLLLSPAVGFLEGYIREHQSNGAWKQIQSGGTFVDTRNSTAFNRDSIEIANRQDPLRFADRAFPVRCPVIILHGANDTLVHHENSAKLERKLQSNNVRVQLIRDAEHGFTPDESCLECLAYLLQQQQPE